jgi:hypothetical protein
VPSNSVNRYNPALSRESLEPIQPNLDDSVDLTPWLDIFGSEPELQLKTKLVNGGPDKVVVVSFSLMCSVALNMIIVARQTAPSCDPYLTVKAI